MLILGLLVEKVEDIELKSSVPVGGDKLWDNFLSYCPFMALLRYAFNPVVIGGGSDGLEMQYVNSPKFVFCFVWDHFNYLYLLPVGLHVHTFHEFCARN